MIVLSKVTVPVAVVSRKRLVATVTASLKVAEVANGMPCPTLRLSTFTVPEAKNVLAPSTFKSPNSVLLEPTAPLRMIAPEDAVRVRSLPETEASTLPVMVMLPTLFVLITALAEVVIRFPVTSALAPLRTKTALSILVALVARVASETKPPTAVVVTGAPKITSPAVDLALTLFDVVITPKVRSAVAVAATAPAEVIVPTETVAPVKLSAPEPVTAPVKALTLPKPWFAVKFKALRFKVPTMDRLPPASVLVVATLPPTRTTAPV